MDIEDLDKVLHIQEEVHNTKAKMAEEVLKMLTKQLNALTIKIDSFDGTGNVQEFLDDFNDYCKEAGKNTEAEKLAVLKNNLHGNAKEWYRLQPTETWAEISTSILDRYGLTDNQKHAAKAKLFAATQQPQETFSNFVSRVQKLARDTTVNQDELVTISINGARPQIRAHLQMVSPAPATIAALLKLPIVSDDTLQHQLNPGYEALVAEIASLNQQVAAISTTKQRDTSSSRDRSPRHVTFRTRSTSRSLSRDSRRRSYDDSRRREDSRHRRPRRESSPWTRDNTYFRQSRSPFRNNVNRNYQQQQQRCGRCSTFCRGGHSAKRGGEIVINVTNLTIWLGVAARVKRPNLRGNVQHRSYQYTL